MSHAADTAEDELAAWEWMKRALLPAAAGAVLGLAATVALLVVAAAEGKRWEWAAEITAFWLVFLRRLPDLFASAICLALPYRGPRTLAGISLLLGLAAFGVHIATLRIPELDLIGRVIESLQMGAFLTFMVAASQYFRRGPGFEPLKKPLLVATLALLALATGFELLALTEPDRRAKVMDQWQAERAARTGRADPDLRVDVEKERAGMSASLTCCNPFKVMMLVAYLFLIREFGDQLENHLDRLRREVDPIPPG